MSDLDKAIRDAVAFGGLPLTGRFEAAFAAVLDLHAPQILYPLVPNDVRCAGCSNHVVRVDYPCATVLGIARELRVPVSSQDTPAPRPCTAKGVNLEKQLVLDCEFEDGHDGWHQQGDSFWRAGAPERVLAEVLSESPSTKGGER